MERKKFERLFKEIVDAHNPTSSILDTKHPNYRRIILGGEAVLPYIIENLKSDIPWINWVDILEKITKCNPVPEKHWGKMDLIIQDWIVWYERIYLADAAINRKNLVGVHLDTMLRLDKNLYEQILDSKFSYHFNEIVQLAIK